MNDPKTMDLATAKVEVSNAVYEATRLIEDLEHTGKVLGNGHHIRQRIAQFAVDELTRSWAGEDKSC